MNKLIDQPAPTPDLTIYPGITSPPDNTSVDFTKPLSITWESNGQEVIRFYIRVGTDDGKWDVISAEIDKRINHVLLDISSLPQDIEKLYLKLAYTQMVTDRITFMDMETKQPVEREIVEEQEMERETPLIIYRKKEIAA